jgi:hypothetical protein
MDTPAIILFGLMGACCAGMFGIWLYQIYLAFFKRN